MADTYTYTDIPGENNGSYTYNGNIINVDPHAGNQDPQPYDGGDDIQVLTPAQEANKVNEKIITIQRTRPHYSGNTVWWYHRGKKITVTLPDWATATFADVENGVVTVLFTGGGSMNPFRYRGRFDYGTGSFIGYDN